MVKSPELSAELSRIFPIRMVVLSSFVVIISLLVMVGRAEAAVCPPTMLVDPNSIDFDYDPNLVNYKLMCVVKAEAGEKVVKTVSACDPDNERMSFALLNEPNEMLILPGVDPNTEAQILWTAVEGMYYVDVIVIDHPLAGDRYSKADRGSMIYKVYPVNRAPVFARCDGDLNGDGKMDFEDFAIFASIWQDCR